MSLHSAKRLIEKVLQKYVSLQFVECCTTPILFAHLATCVANCPIIIITEKKILGTKKNLSHFELSGLILTTRLEDQWVVQYTFYTVHDEQDHKNMIQTLMANAYFKILFLMHKMCKILHICVLTFIEMVTTQHDFIMLVRIKLLLLL